MATPLREIVVAVIAEVLVQQFNPQNRLEIQVLLSSAEPYDSDAFQSKPGRRLHTGSANQKTRNILALGDHFLGIETGPSQYNKRSYRKCDLTRIAPRLGKDASGQPCYSEGTPRSTLAGQAMLSLNP